MKIEKIKINNYKLFNEFELKFNKPTYEYYKNIYLSVLVGENGTGKTTLLKSIAEKFCPESFKNGNFNSDKVKIEYEIENGIYSTDSDSKKLFPKKVIASSYTVFDKHEPIPKRILDKKENSSNTRYCYCAPNENKYGSLDMVLEFIIKILKKDNDTKRRVLSRLMKKISNDNMQYVEIQNSIWMSSIRDEGRRLRNNSRNYYRYCKLSDEEKEEKLRVIDFLEKEYLEKIKEIRHQLGREFRTDKGFKVPIDVFLEELYEGYIVAVSNDFRSGVKDIYLMNELEEEIRLSEMSSGEITMLFRFLPLIFEVEDNSIIIIDEPETHLHPKWIAEFIDYLVEFIGEYKTHIIIATHSPKIVSDLPRECIIGLKKEDGEIRTYVPTRKTLGAEATVLFKDVFGIDKIQSKFIEKIYSEIEKILDKENISEDEIKSVLNIYNDLTSNLEKYELYQRYKDILERSYVEN